MWKIAMLAAGLAVAASPAAATTMFGSQLWHEPTPPENCNSQKARHLCSWVLTTAYKNVGREKAPKTGTIVLLRLRSCTPGSFVLQIARADPATRRAQVVRTGPAINYVGARRNCNGGSFIEAFPVNVPVEKGDYLAVVASQVGFIYNADGSGTLVYDPLLPDGGGLRTTDGTGLGSGVLLLQALYND